jgi:ABC-type transport system involved in multi-copper enzyme maturation permease subunit
MNPAGIAAWVNGLQVSIGLLLLSVSAATSLGEERDRGTLDALLVTPLSTRSIVWGKWWGSFRRVPLLVILPTLLVAALSMSRRFVESTATIAVLVLCYGAFLTSLGLALSTWVQRIGRAVAITVGIYVVLCVGSLFMFLAVTNGRYFERLATVSPFFGAGTVTFESSEQSLSVENRGWPLGWGVAYAGGAVLLFLVTLVIFDRRLGRMPERHAFGWPQSAPWSLTIELRAALSPAGNEVIVLQPATLLPSVERQSPGPACTSSPVAGPASGRCAN